MKALFRTQGVLAPLVLRLTLAGVIFPHGAQKVLGWFEGRGMEATLKFFTETLKIHPVLAQVAVWTEFVAPILLVLGLLTRISALGIGILIGTAAYMVHWKYGFFMNWTGQQAGEGIEYHILVAGMALAILIQGAGKCSVDWAMFLKMGGGEEKKEQR